MDSKLEMESAAAPVEVTFYCMLHSAPSALLPFNFIIQSFKIFYYNFPNVQMINQLRSLKVNIYKCLSIQQFRRKNLLHKLGRHLELFSG